MERDCRDFINGYICYGFAYSLASLFIDGCTDSLVMWKGEVFEQLGLIQRPQSTIIARIEELQDKIENYNSKKYREWRITI